MCIFGFFFLFRLLCIPSSSHTRYLYLSLLYSLTSIRRWWSALVYYLNYALQRFGRLSNSILINSQSHTVWVRLNVILKFCVWASVCSWFVFVFVVSSLELVGRMRAWMGKAQWQINAAQNNFFQFYSDTNEMIILFSAISSKSHDFYWMFISMQTQRENRNRHEMNSGVCELLKPNKWQTARTNAESNEWRIKYKVERVFKYYLGYALKLHI